MGGARGLPAQHQPILAAQVVGEGGGGASAGGGGGTGRRGAGAQGASPELGDLHTPAVRAILLACMPPGKQVMVGMLLTQWNPAAGSQLLSARPGAAPRPAVWPGASAPMLASAGGSRPRRPQHTRSQHAAMLHLCCTVSVGHPSPSAPRGPASWHGRPAGVRGPPDSLLAPPPLLRPPQPSAHLSEQAWSSRPSRSTSVLLWPLQAGGAARAGGGWGGACGTRRR